MGKLCSKEKRSYDVPTIKANASNSSLNLNGANGHFRERIKPRAPSPAKRKVVEELSTDEEDRLPDPPRKSSLKPRRVSKDRKTSDPRRVSINEKVSVNLPLKETDKEAAKAEELLASKLASIQPETTSIKEEKSESDADDEQSVESAGIVIEVKKTASDTSSNASIEAPIEIEDVYKELHQTSDEARAQLEAEERAYREIFAEEQRQQEQQQDIERVHHHVKKAPVILAEPVELNKNLVSLHYDGTKLTVTEIQYYSSVREIYQFTKGVSMNKKVLKSFSGINGSDYVYLEYYSTVP